ncbi:hypothetical protein BD311DRAFT_68977 [Dichomitus squalens]|uniref:Uncharacterized protein n=1 Tax=Dichomitus squalens TaxID=114155 RepID=A0A4Q9MBG1_9APHY|nr:hypothetical protein BD311DRAFT_68977 [Dichomitus squalens]
MIRPDERPARHPYPPSRHDHFIDHRAGTLRRRWAAGVVIAGQVTRRQRVYIDRRRRSRRHSTRSPLHHRYTSNTFRGLVSRSAHASLGMCVCSSIST